MAINTTTSFSGATTPSANNVLKLMVAAARMTPQLPGNLTTLVLNDPLPPGMGTSWNSPKFGTFTAYSLTQGVDMAQLQSLTATNIVITPAEVGVQAVFTKKSLGQWSENVQIKAGQIMRQAMDRKKDIDIGGLFIGLDRTAGAAGEVMTIGHLTASVAKLAGGLSYTASGAVAAGLGTNAVAQGPFIGVFRPESLHALLRATVGGPFISSAVIKTSVGLEGEGLAQQAATVGVDALFAGTIGGVQLYRNSNLAKDSGDDVHSAVMVKEALVYVPFNGNPDTGEIAIEEDVSLRAIEMNYVEDYGFGELDGNLGIDVVVDGTAPTT